MLLLLLNSYVVGPTREGPRPPIHSTEQEKIVTSLVNSGIELSLGEANER